jgi:uncharacterized protein
MFGEHHDLMHEFPELKERIAALRANHPEFARLMDEYDALDEQILRMEQRVEPTSNDHEEELKKKRVHLKDQLYAMLRAG